MHLIHIIVIVSLLTTIACNKGNDMAVLDDQLITWTIGADHATDTTLKITHSGEGRLSMSDHSVCPNHDTRIAVSLGSNTILDTVMVNTTTTIVLKIPELSVVEIKTSLELNGELSQCVWLGQAAFQYLYFD